MRSAITHYKWQDDVNYLNSNLLDLPSSVQVTNNNCPLNSGVRWCSWTEYAYDQLAVQSSNVTTQHVAAGVYRGNLNYVKKHLDAATTTDSTAIFYDTGEVAQSLDPRQSANSSLGYTSFAYSAAFAGAYVTQTTDALGHSISGNYDFNSGLLTSFTDQNNKTKTYAYDNMWRISSVTLPDGGGSNFYYPDTHTVERTQKITTTSSSDEFAYFDGLGRTTRTRLADPEGDVYADTTYDTLGRTATVSNPYRNGDAPPYSTTRGLTQYAYDALGRTTAVTKQDGGIAGTAYAGNTVTVTDETGKQRKSTSDALGRLTAIVEPNPATGSLSSGAFNTYYSYDALGNLLTVNQQGDGTGTARNRYFSYDSLSRLATANNPESGVQSYTYDANGNVLTKTDARGIIATSTYDALNRITTKSFSDGSNGYGFTYDAVSIWGISTGASIGRLVYADRHVANTSTVSAVNNFAYDSLGRVSSQFGCTPSNCGTGTYTINAAYNMAGDMTSLTYPSGRVVTYAYNSANRNSGVTFASFNGVSNGYQYLSMPQHFASGADYVSTFGNGITETKLLNNRLQGQQITFSNPTFGTLSDLAYTFTDPVTGKNNGNVYSIADQLNSSRTQNFGYDQLNRLTSAQTSGTHWGNTYVIDAWGNLIQKNQITGKAAGEFLQVQADSTNRLIGYTYDAGGNMTNDGSHSFQFDADNQITTVNGTAATYSYGPDGQRVRKVVGSASSDYIYWHGQALGVWNGAADWSDYIFDAGGKRIARADNYEDRVLMQGTNCANCGWLYTLANMHTGSGLTLNGYVIQTGDKLLVRQYQPTGVQGGVGMYFTDGYATWDYSLADQDGQDGIYDTVMNTWHSRRFNLTPFAGKTINLVVTITEGGTPPGPWSIYYQDYVLLSADGTVHKIYSHDTSVTWDMWGTAG